MKPDFRLYLITDRKLFGSADELLQTIDKALAGGVRAVQLREKDLDTRLLLALAYSMRKMTKRYGAKLFINDRADIALAVGADGVQLGRAGMPVQAVRKLSGDSLMIGVSTHSVAEAFQAKADGADFITLGPVYATPSKLRYGNPIGIQVLQDAAGSLGLPVFAIGGIRIDRVTDVLRKGAYGIALISAVLTATDVRKTAEAFMRELS